jgi:hypothetical protein
VRAFNCPPGEKQVRPLARAQFAIFTSCNCLPSLGLCLGGMNTLSAMHHAFRCYDVRRLREGWSARLMGQAGLRRVRLFVGLT